MFANSFSSCFGLCGVKTCLKLDRISVVTLYYPAGLVTGQEPKGQEPQQPSAALKHNIHTYFQNHTCCLGGGLAVSIQQVNGCGPVKRTM